jgi:predicted ATP-dependent endonuclease of OLD family
MKSRIQMLTYSNSATVFFADHVVLIEGYGDGIFFKKYFKSYSEKYKKDISKISLLEMGSKNNYKKWYEFLQEFDIKISYIGDADNLKNSPISTQSDKWEKLFPKKMLQKEIQVLEQNENSEFLKMLQEIQTLMAKKIFLLSEGSFEDYFTKFSTHASTTENITSFCTTDKFDKWFNSNNHDKYAKELINIVSKIIH